MNPIVVASPHLVCYVNGNILGNATSFSYSIKTVHDEKRGIDSNKIQELVPTIYQITGTVGVIQTRGTTLEQSRITAAAKDQLLFKYITIQLFDRVTERVVFTAKNAVVDDQQWSVQPKGVLQGYFSFKAISHE